jgi:hypothetical protein
MADRIKQDLPVLRRALPATRSRAAEVLDTACCPWYHPRGGELMDTTTPRVQTSLTESIEVRVSKDDLQRIEERAQQAGIDPAECAGQLIRSGLDADALVAPPHAGMSFAELLAPVHREFEASGMSDEDLDEFFEAIREEVWQEKRQQENS